MHRSETLRRRALAADQPPIAMEIEGLRRGVLASSPWHAIRSARGVSFAFLRRRDGNRGNVAVEAALALPVILLLILAIFDYARIHHTRTRLQDAVSQAMRFAITGSELADPNDPGTLLSRKDSVLRALRDLSGIRDLDDGNVKITSIREDGTESSEPGGPGDALVVEVTYAIEVVTPLLSAAFPDKRYHFTCSSRLGPRNSKTVLARLADRVLARLAR